MLRQRVGAVSNQKQEFKLLSLLKNASLEFCKVLCIFYSIEISCTCTSPSVVMGGEFKKIVINM
jgi:hypothetical protein